MSQCSVPNSILERLVRLAATAACAAAVTYLAAHPACDDKGWTSVLAIAAVAPLAALLFSLPHQTAGQYLLNSAGAVVAVVVTGYQIYADNSSVSCETWAFAWVLLGWIPPAIAVAVAGVVLFLLRLMRGTAQ